MKTRASIGEIIFLQLSLAGCVLLWSFFSPPTWFVLLCLGLGAAVPILGRITRTFFPNSDGAQVLPFTPIFFFIIPALDHFPAGPHRGIVSFSTYFTALAVGVGTVEFLL